MKKKLKVLKKHTKQLRPTKINSNPELSFEELKLYNMIVKRTITSHMKPAEYDVYKIKLKNDETKDYGYFTTNYRQIKFYGFLSYGKDIIS